MPVYPNAISVGECSSHLLPSCLQSLATHSTPPQLVDFDLQQLEGEDQDAEGPMRNSWMTNEGAHAIRALNQEAGNVQLPASNRRTSHNTTTTPAIPAAPVGSCATPPEYSTTSIIVQPIPVPLGPPHQLHLPLDRTILGRHPPLTESTPSAEHDVSMRTIPDDSGPPQLMPI